MEALILVDHDETASSWVFKPKTYPKSIYSCWIIYFWRIGSCLRPPPCQFLLSATEVSPCVLVSFGIRLAGFVNLWILSERAWQCFVWANGFFFEKKDWKLLKFHAAHDRVSLWAHLFVRSQKIGCPRQATADGFWLRCEICMSKQASVWRVNQIWCDLPGPHF